MQQPRGGCWAARRLLAAPASPPDPAHPMDAHPMARLETVFSGTTIVLFVATVSYVIFSAVYACIRAARYDARQQGLGWVDGDGLGAAAPREETKRALEAIPVRVVVPQQQRPHDAIGGKEEEEDKKDPDADAGDCAVCLAEYAAGDEVRVLPACRHGFHRECVDRWLLTRAPTCPVCRATVGAHVEGADAKEDYAAGHGGGIGFAAGSHALPEPV
ncbi:probable E3 ubiquitin-protein ligase ATL44 [Triticum urartu]|uniref:probable E3 ubiquitin-protein ligase ATL44 n=1 Tax=Triticum urartu TaxID=4572 RepID=UPI002043D7D6|nr:probable E3 ubiquitin-protein ligase ATL44 [Triticum urartu]